MARGFKLEPVLGAERNLRFWLRALAVLLGLLNAVALYLILAPPGGGRQELSAELDHLSEQVRAARARSVRMRSVSKKINLGSDQAQSFERKYILPRRTAYEAMLVELERMVKSSGVSERDATFTEEPIEGTADLTLLTNQANYEGTYESLRKFLYQLDHSSLLLMLDTLQAAPQQKGKVISTSMRFQTVVQEDAATIDAANNLEGSATAP